MPKAMLMNWIEGKEIETDLEQYTKLRIGQRCQRTAHNRAMFPEKTDEKEFSGTVLGMEYSGQTITGGNFVAVDVEWDTGIRRSCGSFFLEPARA